MNFFKQNKFFFATLVICLTVFCCLQLVSCNSAESVKLAIDSISKEIQHKNALEEDLMLFHGVEEETQNAIQELAILSEMEKDQHRFWKTILNPTQNIYLNWKQKSPESINADITRLYDRLHDICRKNNISFQEDEKNQLNNFGSKSENLGKKYGFGLSSYDGFWPSFSKSESQLLGIQGKIIESLIEFLIESSDSEHQIVLLQLLRESVGKEDSQHIGADLFIPQNLQRKLVRFPGGIKTYVFKIKFKSHTSHARSFINQLRPPFLLRDLVVNRSDDSDVSFSSQLSPSPFSDPVESQFQSLPIVQNVESIFTLVVEYVYGIDHDIEPFIAQSLRGVKVNEEALSQFLELSGNAKIRTKIDKILSKSENP